MAARIAAAKHSDDVFDRHHEQEVDSLQIDGNRVLRMEQHLVVLGDRHVRVPLHLEADLDNATADRGNLRLVGEDDAPAGCLPVFILADQDPHPQWLDEFIHDQGVSGGLAGEQSGQLSPSNVLKTTATRSRYASQPDWASAWI